MFLIGSAELYANGTSHMMQKGGHLNHWSFPLQVKRKGTNTEYLLQIRHYNIFR